MDLTSSVHGAPSKSTPQSEITEEKRTNVVESSDRANVANETSAPIHERRHGRVAQWLRRQRHLSILVTQFPEAGHHSSFEPCASFRNKWLKALSIDTMKKFLRFSLPYILQILWRIFDNVVLLQMGSVYLIRLHEFAMAADGINDLLSVDEWRKEQQAEWNRLTPTLALLATMQAAILGINKPPMLAYSMWIGGGALSVCGLFTVQYFPIRAFSMTDEDMACLVGNGNEFVNITLLATAVASPVVICLWAAVLFVGGMIDYILESDLGGLKYHVFAAIPVGFGVVTVVMTLILGETIERRMRKKYYPQGLV